MIDECILCGMLHQENGVGLGGDCRCFHEWKNDQNCENKSLPLITKEILFNEIQYELINLIYKYSEENYDNFTISHHQENIEKFINAYLERNFRSKQNE